MPKANIKINSWAKIMTITVIKTVSGIIADITVTVMYTQSSGQHGRYEHNSLQGHAGYHKHHDHYQIP
jgi:hypothetical protein